MKVAFLKEAVTKGELPASAVNLIVDVDVYF